MMNGRDEVKITQGKLKMLQTKLVAENASHRAAETAFEDARDAYRSDPKRKNLFDLEQKLQIMRFLDERVAEFSCDVSHLMRQQTVEWLKQKKEGNDNA